MNQQNNITRFIGRKRRLNSRKHILVCWWLFVPSSRDVPSRKAKQDHVLETCFRKPKSCPSPAMAYQSSALKKPTYNNCRRHLRHLRIQDASRETTLWCRFPRYRNSRRRQCFPIIALWSTSSQVGYQFRKVIMIQSWSTIPAKWWPCVSWSTSFNTLLVLWSRNSFDRNSESSPDKKLHHPIGQRNRTNRTGLNSR